MYLLDTNHCSHLLQGHPAIINKLLHQFLSEILVGPIDDETALLVLDGHIQDLSAGCVHPAGADVCEKTVFAVTQPLLQIKSSRLEPTHLAVEGKP